MHRLLDSYATQVCREASARGDSRARLAAVTLEKRALSSAGSLGLSVRRRLALLAQESSGPREFQPALPLDEAEGETETGDEPPSSVLAAPGLADANRERRWLSAIAECAENASRAESKARRLLRLVARMQQPVIVFTEFRDTLERLYVLLARPGRDLKRLHGGLSPRERVLVIDEFRDRGGTLLATDAASEGLNLHPTCHVVIHYELPWSPARLEQRTGRVDRIGQRHTVHEILLVARDTAERVVLAPLARRAARARSAAGSFSHLLSALSDSRVAEAVMDGRPLDSESGCEAASEVAGACSPPETLAGEAAEEAARIKQQRDWLLASPPLKPDGGTVATTVRLRKSQSRPVVICVYAIALVTRAGASVWRRVACAREAWPAGAAIRTAADARSLASAFLEGRETELRAGILAAHASEIEANARMHARALQSEEERERSMAEALPSAASELVQAGLFDRRALKELEARRVAAHALLDGTRIRMGALKKDRTLETIVELTAILFVPGDSP